MLNYDAILFDVDGTLIDSAPGIINTLKEVFARMGVDTTNVNLRRYLGPPLRKSFDALAQKTFGISFEGWYRAGHWSDSYIPYVLAEGDTVLANASAFMNRQVSGS